MSTATDSLARQMLEAYLAEYDGPEFPGIEAWAEVEYPHLSDEEFFASVEEASRLAEDASYVFAFGYKPCRDERGTIVSDPRHGPDYWRYELANREAL